MVACLERTYGNAEFHQIVYFLTTSLIHYALTQIHATVDGKTVVISKSSVRSDLHFNDEDGNTYLSNDEIFVNLALIGVIRAATTATSLEVEQESGNINKTQSTTTLNESYPQGTGLGSGPRCQDTTLGDADAQTRFETASKKSHDPPLSEVTTSRSRERSMEHQDDLTDFVSPTPHDSPLSGGHTPRSDKGRPNITELMAICTKLSNRVLALEQSKTAQDLVIKKLQKKVKRLEKQQRARTPGMNLFKIGDIDDNRDDINDMVDEAIENVEGDTVNAVGTFNTTSTRVSAGSASVTTAGVSISTAEPRTPPTTITTVFEDEDLTIAQTLVKIRSEKAKEKGVAFRDVEESARPTKILPTIDLKDKGKGIMMHEKEMVEFKKRQSEISAVEEASRAAIKTAINQELDDIQAMIEADEKMDSRLQFEEQEQYTIEEKSRMLVEMIVKRKRFFGAQRAAEQTKDEQEKEELRLCLKIVQDEDKAINYETLAVKSSIINWETQQLGNKTCLHGLVMKRFKSVVPEGYDLILWGDLKTMIKPNKEDEI
uniref:Uncharacterized protein n=1 Tax=Tanacetum cinerariifolium TaxID=118510 RepID=A0A6L2KCN9_TANCI|nr:hypothetical protein [Tanacetum cinerariifolium]